MSMFSVSSVVRLTLRRFCEFPILTRWFVLKDLKDYMRQAGEVTYADAHKQHRNEGYVMRF